MSTDIVTNINGYVKYSVLRNGNLIDSGETHNMVVFSSRALIAKVASGYDEISSPEKFGPIKLMAIGSGSTATKITDTQLENELYRQNIAVANTSLTAETGNIVTATSTSVTLTIRTKLTPFSGSTGFPASALSGSVTISEFGLLGGFDSTQTSTPPGDFGSSTAGIKGTLFNRALIGPVLISPPSDTLLIENIITWG